MTEAEFWNSTIGNLNKRIEIYLKFNENEENAKEGYIDDLI
ncbi:MAG: hypothetical protein RR662_03810 [Clostridia bacterium]